jgi:FkbM family methyltransferase
MSALRDQTRVAKRRVGGTIARSLASLRGGGLTIAGATRCVNVRVQPRVAFEAPAPFDLDLVGAALTATRGEIGFVQIGAFDGRANDPLYGLIHRFGWRGVLVEPQPSVFARLLETYAGIDGLVFLNAAVAEARGTQTLWALRDVRSGDPTWLRQVASFNRDHVLRHVGADGAERIVGHEVETMTLDDVISRAPQGMDVLQVDAEGNDGRIVNMLDLERHRPALIQFEHRHLSLREHAQVGTRLADAGYRLAVVGSDTIAVLPIADIGVAQRG